MWLICGRGDMRTGLVWKGEGNQPPGSSKCRCEDDIKVDLK